MRRRDIDCPLIPQSLVISTTASALFDNRYGRVVGCLNVVCCLESMSVANLTLPLCTHRSEPSFDLSILLTKGLFVKISPRLEQLPGRYGCFSCTATPSISVAISGLYLTVAQSVSLINHCSPTENVQLGIASSEQPVGPIHEETAAQRSFPGYC